MIQAEHKFEIRAPIAGVWDYVQDMQRWAAIFPGCRECKVIDANDSVWVIKVGVGGLVRTVNVLVHVDQWQGPQQVDFSFKLESEPVVGSGSYQAVANGSSATGVALQVVVQGSGQMAPMWEAMCKPLLPTLARSFAEALTAEIEREAGVPVVVKPPSLMARFFLWLRQLWRGVFSRGHQP